MERKNNLIKEDLPRLMRFSYYRQRFDACPHFMFFLGDAHGSDTNHSRYPYGQRISCAYFSRNKADWLHPIDELQHTASKITELAKSNPRIAKEMIAEFSVWEKKFYAQCKEIARTDLKRLSDAELIKLYDELGRVYTKKLNPSPLIDGFALSTDTVISQQVESFLESKNMLSGFVKTFEILTAPIFLSFLQKEEIDLLKLAEKARKDPSRKDDRLAKHQQNYFWIHNNYVKDDMLSIDFFRENLERFMGEDPAKRIKTMERIPKDNMEKKKESMKTLGLPKDIITLISITDSFSEWQDERKKGTFWATHYFSLLLEEFSRRTGYGLQELKYALPSEIDSIFQEKISKEELRKRFEGCLFVWTTDRFDITTDKQIIESILESKEKNITEKEIRGLSVSLGKASGKVKIIESAEEISKVKEGDIMVAVMTRPDYVPAMKKAAGVITDEGGLTCHAAIVARELGIPCIVGTRTATKTLKDNDLVEVDANHGVIRILRQ